MFVLVSSQDSNSSRLSGRSLDFLCSDSRFGAPPGGMPSENSAFAGTDALLPNGQPNLYSVAGNQIHGERLKKQNLVDSEWWARHRRVADLKFQYAVGAVPDKKKLVWPEQPKMKLGLEAADSVSDAEFLRMSTMQSDFYWGQTSELWDYYNKTGALQKKTYNKKGLPNCAHGSRTSRRRSARAFPRPPLTSRRRPLRCRLRGDAARHQRGRHRLLLQSALTLRMPRAGAWSVAAPRHAGQQLAAMAGPQCAQRGLSTSQESALVCGWGPHLRVVLLAALGCIIEAKD